MLLNCYRLFWAKSVEMFALTSGRCITNFSYSQWHSQNLFWAVLDTFDNLIEEKITDFSFTLAQKVLSVASISIFVIFWTYKKQIKIYSLEDSGATASYPFLWLRFPLKCKFTREIYIWTELFSHSGQSECRTDCMAKLCLVPCIRLWKSDLKRFCSLCDHLSLCCANISYFIITAELLSSLCASNKDFFPPL